MMGRVVLGVLGIYSALMLVMNISGGHLNPAISFALAVHQKFPYAKVPAYILS